MKENTIISLADSNYFNLLNELIDSINRFEQSKNLRYMHNGCRTNRRSNKNIKKKYFK